MGVFLYDRWMKGSMKKYRIVVAYDGHDFQGWQSQPHGKTIADTIERAFLRAFGEHIVLAGASRTDAGVHALGQVAFFSASGNVCAERMLPAWCASLPSSIVIRSLVEYEHDIHPHHDVEEKTYLYHIFYERPLPFLARYGWYYPYMQFVNRDLMKSALQAMVGTHDFRSFCKLEDERSTVRTINQISVIDLPHLGALRIRIRGDGFLRFQIRRMIGAALDVARRPGFSVSMIEDMLKNPNPQQHFTRAEPHGLCLAAIRYKKEKR